MLLAIESAIAGGSVSLMLKDTPTASWKGTSDVSRAEDLLPAIATLMSANGIDRGDISTLAVSAGPGSFTGIRIGVSTAMGLAAGLSIPIVSASILKAMASTVMGENVLAAVPMGRSAVCVQEFDTTGPEPLSTKEPATVTESEFAQKVMTADGKIVVHGSLTKFCEEWPAVDLGFDLARVLGKYCLTHPGEREKPLFISKSF